MHHSCHKATPLGCLGNRNTPNLPTAPQPVKPSLPSSSNLSAIRNLRTAPQPLEPKKPLFPDLSAIHPEVALLDRAGEASVCRALTRHHRESEAGTTSLPGPGGEPNTTRASGACPLQLGPRSSLRPKMQVVQMSRKDSSSRDHRGRSCHSLRRRKAALKAPTAAWPRGRAHRGVQEGLQPTGSAQAPSRKSCPAKRLPFVNLVRCRVRLSPWSEPGTDSSGLMRRLKSYRSTRWWTGDRGCCHRVAARGRGSRWKEGRRAASPLSELARARVADGTRTRDHRDHNPELYRLSYRHRAGTA
jgi:hypothetical protein